MATATSADVHRIQEVAGSFDQDNLASVRHIIRVLDEYSAILAQSDLARYGVLGSEVYHSQTHF